ncbi:MAG: hypothetical protein AAGC76_09670 [Luteibacter sp.]|uniref:hypothetical protein n=1 Tax=Luteibacter sp. TaxID=1886636 RepID=UPI002807C397|nr:hypothetical protein [Luteibacter sp.]MDQ7996109.1 hypothetical protein [Luteibacter sp.]
MTRDEFMAKHGHVVVKFRSYYKYTFVYEATLPDGSTLTAYYGGNSGEIEVSADSEEALYSLCPYACEVTDKDGKEVESFYDY